MVQLKKEVGFPDFCPARLPEHCKHGIILRESQCQQPGDFLLQIVLEWLGCAGDDDFFHLASLYGAWVKLDHIMYAAADLAAGVDYLRQLTGIEAAYGGSHEGAGTCNALASFGADQYLEIIAPDPQQESGGTMAEELLQLKQPILRTWAAAVSDFDPILVPVSQAGFGHRVINMSRQRPDGVELAWQILFITGHAFGLAMPFFINWLDSPHPAATAPPGMSLQAFNVSHPAGERLAEFFRAVDLEVNCSVGEPAMQAQLLTPRGRVLLS